MHSLDELASEICTLTGHINAANHRWLMLVAEFDRRNGWSDSATQSCAHWLNWKCGIAMGAAREKVRVARALENLPKVSAAMACGKLSYSKAREITRVATAGTEDYLLMIPATRAAAFPAARTPATSMSTMSSTGPTAAKPNPPTSSLSAASITTPCTKAASASRSSTTARCDS
jgi:hypothetical protein